MISDDELSTITPDTHSQLEYEMSQELVRLRHRIKEQDEAMKFAPVLGEKLAELGTPAYIMQERSAMKQQIRDLERKYREALWAGHGCDGIYGDDGELQCNSMLQHGGPIDFKREPLEAIEERLFRWNVKRMNERLDRHPREDAKEEKS